MRARVWGALFLAMAGCSADRTEGATPVAEIHDGDLASCTIRPAACALGRRYHEAERMPGMSLVSSRKVTRATQVNRPFLKEQILAAARVAYEDVATLGGVFAAVDQGELNVRTYRHADGREFVAVEYGAGENSYGAFFAAGGTTQVASIRDGDLASCRAY
jgi:hypothetical protein